MSFFLTPTESASKLKEKTIYKKGGVSVSLKILKYDPWLKPYKKDLQLRAENLEKKIQSLLPKGETLETFASGHQYFGFHKTQSGWFYREWAPAAEKLYLTGDFCNWERYAYPMEKKKNGVFELFLSLNSPLWRLKRCLFGTL